MDCNSEFCSNVGIQSKLLDLNECLDKLTEESSNRFSVVNMKLDSIYFENEVIKHQLKLEDDIRNAIEEVNNLNNIIACAISQIDKFIKV